MVDLERMWDGSLYIDLVGLCLLEQMYPDAGDGHLVGAKRLIDVRHQQRLLLRVQQVVQL